MKKIIALAVAGAFVAPVYAAEISVGGEVEVTMTNTTTANTIATATSEVTVTATEEMANGMSVAAYVQLNDEQAGTEDDTMPGGITISGPFGSITTGIDEDNAATSMDDFADVAETGGGNGAFDGVVGAEFVRFNPNLGIEGLAVALGYEAGGTAATEATEFAISYSVGGLKVAYQAENNDDDTKENVTGFSASYTMGPLYVAMDSQKDADGTAGQGNDAIGITYNYGPGKVYYESNESGAADTEEVAYGVSYNLGGVVNTYLGFVNEDGADDKTVVGVEYAF